MLRLLLFLAILVYSAAANSQEKHRFAGYVQMPGNPLVSYYLDLVIKENRITGYSITDYTGGNRLKASVVGRMKTASEIYIEETGSLDGPHSNATAYCYFSAHLKLAVTNGKQRWSGSFESRQADGSPCHPSTGHMTILDNAPALDAPKQVAPSGMRVQQDAPKVMQAPSPKQVPLLPKEVPPAPKPALPKDTVRPPLMKAEAPRVVVPPAPRPKAVPQPKAPPPAPRDTNNCLRSFQWTADSLSFDIWDGWTVDGDVVSLSLGGRLLMDHSKLSESKQHFSMPLKPGLNILEILLHEEGFDAPNTPNMTLYEGAVRHELHISGNPGETARICIIRAH